MASSSNNARRTHLYRNSAFALATLGVPIRKTDFLWGVITESTYAPGQVLRRHAHKNPFLTIPCRGQFEISTTKHSIQCNRSSVLFCPAQQRHANRYASTGARSLIVELKSEYAETLNVARMLPATAVVLPPSVGFRWANRVRGEFCAPDSASTTDMESVLLELLASFRILNQQYECSGDSARLGRVLDRVHDEFDQTIPLAQLAKTANLHPLHMARIFRAQMGCSIGQYVRRLRVDRAALELRDSRQSILQIALDLGFFDQAHFSRCFKRWMGVTPGRYRQTCRDGHE